MDLNETDKLIPREGSARFVPDGQDDLEQAAALSVHTFSFGQLPKYSSYNRDFSNSELPADSVRNRLLAFAQSTKTKKI
jgi:hypothetical protein